jgi:hypothetical protein
MQNRRDILAGLAAVPVLGAATLSSASADPVQAPPLVPPSAVVDGRRQRIKAVQYYVQRYINEIGCPVGAREWYVGMNDAIINDIGIFFGADDLPSFEMVEQALATPMDGYERIRLTADMHNDLRIGRDMVLGWDALTPADQFSVRQALMSHIAEGIHRHRRRMLLQGFRAVTLMPLAINLYGASKEPRDYLPCWTAHHRYIAVPLGQEASV